jgi:hypothetical protein
VQTDNAFLHIAGGKIRNNFSPTFSPCRRRFHFSTADFYRLIRYEPFFAAVIMPIFPTFPHSPQIFPQFCTP